MTNPSTHADLQAAHELALRNFRLMEDWNDTEASAIIAATMVNDEATAEPPAARAPGVAGARATYDWLHAAYDDLHWTIHKLVAEGDSVVAHTTMSGRQVGPFVTYTPDGQVRRVFPATGRSFAATQTHWFRIANGQLIEHHANRDDMSQAMQQGWM
jgi:predicted ester cyclase